MCNTNHNSAQIITVRCRSRWNKKRFSSVRKRVKKDCSFQFIPGPFVAAFLAVREGFFHLGTPVLPSTGFFVCRNDILSALRCTRLQGLGGRCSPARSQLAAVPCAQGARENHALRAQGKGRVQGQEGEPFEKPSRSGTQRWSNMAPVHGDRMRVQGQDDERFENPSRSCSHTARVRSRLEDA